MTNHLFHFGLPLLLPTSTTSRQPNHNLKSVTSFFNFHLQTTFDDNQAVNELWQKENGESVWLVHRGGFCAAIQLPSSSGGTDLGKMLIQLEHNGEQLIVDEDDIEKANPAKFDLVEDICHLKHLNEASVLHVLRQRYANNLIHTRAGPILMVVNPMAPLSLYSEKVSCALFTHFSLAWSSVV